MMMETAAAVDMSCANIGSSSSDYYSSREITSRPKRTTVRSSDRNTATRQLRFCSNARTTVLLFAVVFAVSANSVSQIHAFAPATYTFVSLRGGDPRTQRSAAFAGSRRNSRLDITTTTTPLYKRPQQHSVLLSASKSNEHTTTAAAAGDLSSSGGGGGSLETAAGSVSATTAGNPPFSVTLDDGSKYSYGEAIQRTLGWVGAAIIFGGGLWAVAGSQTGQEFFAGYLVEQSLSVDNLFVFLLLFEYFKVPLQYQDRVLNWGIYGAVVMRAIMIGIGAAALQQFHAILLVFAGILVYSSASFFIGLIRGGGDEEDEDPGQNSIVRFSRSLIQATEHFDGDRFFTLVDGVRQATPLFICMIAVEISDVVFAVDSIPAVFGVTENPLVVFTSNIFAIMGLRSLYTILSKAATDLKYLEPAVALVLGFIGAKMIAEYFDYLIPTNIALAVVATLLGSGVGLSVLEKQKELEEEDIAVDDKRKSS